MAGFAVPNPYINRDIFVDVIEAQKKEREEAEKARRPKFPASQQKCYTCSHYCDTCKDILTQERANQAVSGHSARDTLCFCCIHSIDNGCQWMACKREVPGWVAKKKTYEDRGATTYHVIDCPNFKRGRG